MATTARPGRTLVRLFLVLAALGLSWLVLRGQFDGITGAAVWLHLSALDPARAAAALAMVALAFLAVAGQERAALAHLALDIAPGRQRLAAMAAASVSQTVGFGPVVGAILRRRALPELTLAQSAAVSAAITLGFFAGLCVILLACAALRPGLPLHDAAPALLAVLAVALPVAALAPGSRILGLRKPNLIVTGRFLGWLAVDLAALCTALWLVLPGAPPLASLFPLFAMALGTGLMSGSPGGAGPFEAALTLGLPGHDPAALVAGLLAFRALAFALPALCGGLWLMCLPAPAATPPAAPRVAAPVPLSWTALARLPMAEAQLALQGTLHLIAAAPGRLWLSADLPHTRVVLGDPMPVGDGSAPAARALLRSLAETARAEGRVACLYKVGPRLAAQARRAGLAVLPVAREAVLDPVAFSTAGPARAALRRKLARARKAGVSAEPAARPPLHEMAAVARAWARRHGGERGFSMGVWNPATVLSQRVFAARAADGRLLAFVSFHAAPGEWVLDLVRCRADMPDGTMYLLVHAALQAAAAQGLRRLTLAAVPEPAFRPARRSLAWLPVLHRMAGLLQFKAAFAPRWERRYIAAPGRLALALGAAEIGLAVRWPAGPARLPGVRDRRRPAPAAALRLAAALGRGRAMARLERVPGGRA
jgi:phosphatidylglycerol lysyltransferase